MEINMDTIPIYIINLDRRPDRWENTKNQMKIFNDNYIRFSAVDTNNTIGCALSYYKLLEEHKDIDYIMILQDDVQFLDYSKEVFSNTLKEVPNDWDVILSGVHYGKYRSKITSNVVELSDFSGLQMAIIKPRILPLLKKWNKQGGFDRFFREFTNDNLIKIYCILPFCSIQNDGYSDLRKKDTTDYELFKKSEVILSDAIGHNSIYKL